MFTSAVTLFVLIAVTMILTNRIEKLEASIDEHYGILIAIAEEVGFTLEDN